LYIPRVWYEHDIKHDEDMKPDIEGLSYEESMCRFGPCDWIIEMSQYICD
jgi:hypothetical protein